MINKIEEAKRDTQNVSASSNKGKNRNGLFLYFFILILITILVYIFFINNNNKNTIQKQKVVEQYNDSVLRAEIQDLNNKIKILEDETVNNTNDINVVRVRVEEHDLEIGKNQIDPQRIELIKLALDVQKYIQNGENYENILNSMKILMKGNNRLKTDFDILFKYRNSVVTRQNIENVFHEEMKKFIADNNLLSKKNTDFARFMSRFVIVRKTDNTEKNSANDFLNFVEKNIKMQDYVDILNIVEKNKKYAEYFPETIKYITIDILVNNSIQNVIGYLVNN